jgi:TolB protein
MSKLAVLALLTCAAVALAPSRSTSRAAGSKRAGTIAFIRMMDPRFYGGPLFVVRPDGSDLRRVTPQSTRVWWYAWSPDGRLIAYIDNRSSLWLVRADGTGRRLLLPASQLRSVGLSWSPNGKDIAIVSPGPDADPRNVYCGNLAIYRVPVDGSTPALVSARRRGIGCGVAWSPGGGEIAYGAGSGVLGVIPSSGGPPRLLLTSGVGRPQWSPDGTKLAAPTVIHRRLGTFRYNRITAVDADGSDPHVVTDHAYTEYPFAWSPDSRQILYGRQGRQGIYVIGTDGRNDHRITRDSPPPAGWGALAWSPTGRSIVYATDRRTQGPATRPGNVDLYLIDADGRGKVQLTATPDNDIDPSWVAR